MLLSRKALLIVAASIFAQPIAAQSSNTPGVTQVTPGVQQIDGSQVPATKISVSALTAAIEKDRSFSAIKRLFTVEGITNPGPAGTTTYMYKIRDPETGQDAVAILFVKSGRIIDFMIT